MSEIKPEIIGHIENNLYAKSKSRFLKKSGGLANERLPTQIPKEVAQSMNDYFNVHTGPVKNLKEATNKYKKEYQHCLTDFVRFLGKNKEQKTKPAKKNKKIMSKLRTIKAFEKKLSDEIKNEEMSHYYRMRDQVANYVKKM